MSKPRPPHTLINTPDITRKRRESSGPTPPERDEHKKPNTMSSPPISSDFNHVSFNQLSPQGTTMSSPPPPMYTTTFLLHPNDLANIVEQIKGVVRDEISQSVRNLIREEIDSCLKSTFKTLTQNIDELKKENEQLRADIDALEQYSRRELIRVSGVVETRGENTTTIVSDIVKSIDPDLVDGDIIRSHRVGNPNRRSPHPRQIIVRLRDTATKRRILKASKHLKHSENFARVNLNEDLTKRRNTLAYRARQLKNKNYISQTWTVDGKIFIKMKNDSIKVVTTDNAFKEFITANFPVAMTVAYPPLKDTNDATPNR